MFNRSEVIMWTSKQFINTHTHTDKQTNKQTPLKTSTSLRYATPVGHDKKSRYRFTLR